MAGPARFVEHVLEQVRSGRSLLLALPPGIGPWLEARIRALVREQELRRWVSMSCGADHASPAAALHARLALSKSGEGPTAHSIVTTPEFEDHAIWIDDLTVERWPDWERFLETYAHASRAVEPWCRTVFLVTLPVEVADLEQREDVTLGCVRYRSVSDSLDMAAFVAHRARQRAEPTLVRKVRVAVVAELAGADPSLGLEAVDWPLDDLLDPIERLRAWALGRGWEEDDTATACWARGTLEEIDGLERVHGAILALADRRDELVQRVWSGQVGVLFPFLEEQRRLLIRALGSKLRVPVETPHGRIERLQDLELGHIAGQVWGQVLPDGLVQRVRVSVRMRNRLAHGEPVSAGDLVTAAGWREL